MNIVFFLMGMCATPLLVFIAILLAMFVSSDAWPFSGDVKCLVCDRPLGHRWRFWLHERFNRYHVDHFEAWLLKKYPPEFYSNTDAYLARYRRRWFRLHPRNEKEREDHE